MSVCGPGLTWTHFGNNSPRELDMLRNAFGFLDADLRDVAPPLQRSKLLPRKDYLFLILIYPIFDYATKKIRPTEVDIFITRHEIVTIDQGNECVSIATLYAALQRSPSSCESLFGKGIAHAVHTILHTLESSISPMLVHLSNEMDAVQKHIETDYERGTIFEILRIKDNIANAIKAIQGHKHVFEKLIESGRPILGIKMQDNGFHDLVETSKENWDELDGYRAATNALHETNESLISFRVNEIMKTLTIFAVIVFPLTLFAALFSMQTPGTPFVNHPHGFWIVIGIMLVGSVSMYEFFRFKKWL